MEMKLIQTLLGHQPLSDTLCRNPNMMIREQGSGCHRLSDASSHHRLSGTLHQRPNIVSNEQRSTHFLDECEGQES
jgi:hypothetical protein